MKIFSLTLVAGARQDLPSGSYLHFMTGDDTKPVDFQFFKNSEPVLPAVGAKPGYSADFRGLLKVGESKYFTKVSVLSAYNQTIEIGVADAVGGYNRFSGTVTVTGTVNVARVQGTVLGPVAAPINVTSTATLLAAASSTRKKLIFVNDDTANTVDLIDAAGTYGKGIPLAPGDIWEERDLANAAWYGICNSGLTANVRVIVGS